MLSKNVKKKEILMNKKGDWFNKNGDLKSLAVFFLVVLVSLAVFANAFSGGGTGTLADPFVITNCTQLQEMNESLESNYSISVNIDCSDTINWNSGEGFSPVGDNVNAFTGRLFGNEYNITDLFIDRSAQDYVGLFGYSTNGRFYDAFLSLPDNAHIDREMLGPVAKHYKFIFCDQVVCEQDGSKSDNTKTTVGSYRPFLEGRKIFGDINLGV